MCFSDFELPVTTRDQRMLCSGCNMFGSVEDTPWVFGGMTGTIGGMTEIDGKWYHCSECLSKVMAAIRAKQNAVIEQRKKFVPDLKLVPRKEILPTSGEEQEREAA